MFVHLHNHTKFSILDALCRPKQMAERAAELGQTALAITDHGVLYGWVEFYKECQAAGIKPILGCEFYVAPKTIHQKDPHERYNHLVALAKDNAGMLNLQKLCTAGFTEGGMYYGKPRVDDDLLRKYHEGIIFLSGCVAGRIPQLIIKNDYEGAKKAALKYKEMFGNGNFYLEIQDHGDMDERKAMQGLVRLSRETGIPLVATNDCHYIMPDNANAHEILLYMRDSKTINDPSPEYGNGQLYLKSEEEMAELFRSLPDAMENTAKIAEQCNVEISFHDTKMPKAPIPEGSDAFDYLKTLCEKGIKERYPDDDGKIAKQLDYELSVIRKMGFVEYFLVVWEYINWSRSNGVLVGPGRGSAAGSVAMYALGITDIDPVRFGLVFERFLNPERVSMPDIDEDFDDINRYRTIGHVRNLYGNDNVCQIITFGTMAAKKVLKSVGKVYGYEVSFYNKLASLVPKDPGMTITKALETVTDFKMAYDTDADSRKVIDMGLLLEGLPCNTSKHAAGVIIADKPVSEYIPLAVTADGDLVSQFNMVEIEELGLLKMDFLGLKTLSVIENAIKNIKATKGIDISMKDIPYDDEQTFSFISAGKTAGVFQLESAGMMSFMKQLKPVSLEDLIAGVSLYRPGPMDFIPKYIEGKDNPANVTYACPQLEPILKNTYGCIVYQEQVMQIFQQLAGYSLGGADNIRRAMSKKKVHVIEEERKTFIHGDPEKGIPGCAGNGIGEAEAEAIYDSMADFAKYAFNKSHAACYAMISYQTAWLKCHYPSEYMAAIMTTFISDTDKLKAYAHSAKEQGIELLAPHINYSTDACLPLEDGKIRMPLTMCKGAGDDLIAEIMRVRSEKGSFASFQDFITSGITIDKAAADTLIKSGVFDGLGHNRQSLVLACGDIIDNIKKDNKKNIAGQMSLFDIMDGLKEESIPIQEVPEYPDKEKLSLEKKSLGMFMSSNPLDFYSGVIARFGAPASILFKEDEVTGRRLAKPKMPVNMCGYITELKQIYTKDNRAMAFATIEDSEGTAEAVIFSDTYEANKSLLEEDECLLFTGTVSEKEPPSLIVNSVTRLDSLPFRMYIRLSKEDMLEKGLSMVDEINEKQGTGTIWFYFGDTKKKLKTEKRVSLHSLDKAKYVFGRDNVVVR